MCFVADSVTYDACSTVASAVLTLDTWHASCCAKLVPVQELAPFAIEYTYLTAEAPRLMHSAAG